MYRKRISFFFLFFDIHSRRFARSGDVERKTNSFKTFPTHYGRFSTVVGGSRYRYFIERETERRIFSFSPEETFTH